MSRKLLKLFPEVNTHKIKYDNLQISDVGLYSITKPRVSNYIVFLLKRYFQNKTNITITDATGNVGGTTIRFALTFDKVNSVEIDPTHCDMLRNNIEVYNLTSKVNVVYNDFLIVKDNLVQDAVFLDPPWGGTDYKSKSTIDLNLSNIDIIDIINSLINKTKIVVLFAPVNYNHTRLFNNHLFDNVNTHKIYDNKLLVKHYLYVFYNNKTI